MAPHNNTQPRRISSANLRWILFLGFSFATVCFNFYHFAKFHEHVSLPRLFGPEQPRSQRAKKIVTKALKKSEIMSKRDEMLQNAMGTSDKKEVKEKPKMQVPAPNNDPKTPADPPEKAATVSDLSSDGHAVASLTCAKYGGPSDEIAQKEMMYWSDIPKDSHFVSPFHNENDEERYMTFEPDGGGWNNIRMAMETTVVMAHAMGRTLVLPPSQKIYLLGNQKKGQKLHFSFADFFHLDSIDTEHQGMKIISMEQFLERTAMKGKLVNKETGKVQFPPGNRTLWEGRALHEKDLFEYLREVTDVRNWKPGNCLGAFPSAPGKEHIEHLQTMMNNVVKEWPKLDQFDGKPMDVSAPPEQRLREVYKSRKDLCLYDEEMQESLVVHFMCYHKERARMLTHFYTFLFFEDWKHDLWAKRFVRDHLRYIDELQCAAARVVTAIRERALTNDKESQGEFHTYHIRRGDFQYKMTRIDADQILANSKDVLVSGRTVYIATDERDKAFFKPLADYFDICFLDDFKHLFTDLNTNYYGMLDQLIASKGDVFVGTYYSTFTGYINRMRGYHSVKDKEDGHELGSLKSYFFAPVQRKNEMTEYRAIDGLYAREFPISWRGIDFDA